MPCRTNASSRLSYKKQQRNGKILLEMLRSARYIALSMRAKLLVLILAALLAACPAQAGEASIWRVHYSIRGSGRDITIIAQSSQEARRTVKELFRGAVITGMRRVRK